MSEAAQSWGEILTRDSFLEEESPVTPKEGPRRAGAAPRQAAQGPPSRHRPRVLRTGARPAGKGSLSHLRKARGPRRGLLNAPCHRVQTDTPLGLNLTPPFLVATQRTTHACGGD